MKRISPTGDLAFKKVFASVGNEDVLAGLINDFFGIVAEEIIIESPYSIQAYKEVINGEEVPVLRHTLKDVSASLKTADFVSELQISQTRFFDERALYYLLDRYCQNFNKWLISTDTVTKPNRYSSLKPVYSLNILAYNHFKENNDQDALRILEFYDPIRSKSFKQLLRLGFFELQKPHIETDNQRHWRDYFTIGEVSSKSPVYIAKASKIIAVSNLMEEELRVAEIIEKAQAIRDAELSTAFLDGKDEGRVEGKTEVAQMLIKMKIAIEDIAIATGLDIPTLQKLKVEAKC